MPCTISAARAFVAAHHRHSRPPTSGLFAVGVANPTELVGVAIAGRPTARALQDGTTVEITRVCNLPGRPNATTKLYGAILRAARSLGYRHAITYTIASEAGTSLRAAGWTLDGHVPARPWHTPARPRYDTDLFGTPLTPPQPKQRWTKALA